MNSRRSVTTSESPTLNTFMPEPSPSIMRKIISTKKFIRPTPRTSIPKKTPSSSSLQRSQQLDLSTLDVTVTPTESPTYSAEKPTTLNRVTAKMASLQGSVRSSIPGFSTSTTPTSSRRPSITGPSIYARLLYASYSVPPKKIYDYIWEKIIILFTQLNVLSSAMTINISLFFNFFYWCNMSLLLCTT